MFEDVPFLYHEAKEPFSIWRFHAQYLENRALVLRKGQLWGPVTGKDGVPIQLMKKTVKWTLRFSSPLCWAFLLQTQRGETWSECGWSRRQKTQHPPWSLPQKCQMRSPSNRLWVNKIHILNWLFAPYVHPSWRLKINSLQFWRLEVQVRVVLILLGSP